MKSNRYTGLFRRRAALAAAAVCLAAAGAGPAAAEEITTVEMGPAGPNKQLPLGTDFILKGAAETAERVDVVFVRKVYAPFGADTGDACSVLPPARPKESLKAGALVRGGASPGKKDVSDLFNWDAPIGYSAFQVAPWARPAGTEGKIDYSVRVTGDRAFFRPGASYCMYVYTTKREPLEAKGLLAAADELNAALSACDEKQCDEKQAATAGKTCKETFEACENAATHAFAAKREAFIGEAKEAAKQACIDEGKKGTESECGGSIEKLLKGASDKLTEAAHETAPAQRAVRPLIDHWPKLYSTREKLPAIAVLGGPAVKVDSSFARFVLGVLDRHHEIRSGGDPASIKYASLKSTVPVAYLKVGESLTTIEVADKDDIGARREKLTAVVSNMLLPGSSLSLLDIFRLARGRIAVGSRDERIDGELAKEEDLPKLKEQMEALRDVFRRADAAKKARDAARRAQDEATKNAVAKAASKQSKKAGASAAQAGGGDTGQNPTSSEPIPGFDVYADLGDWWARVMTDDCETWRAAVGLPRDTCVTEAVGDGSSKEGKDSKPPRTHLAKLEAPFEALVQRIGTRVSSAEKRKKAHEDLKVTMGKAVVTVSGQVSARVSFEANSWVTQYVTPTVGVAFATSPSETIPIVYGGIKLYPWPNPADEPMWSNGAMDLFRVVGIEVGLGTQNKDLGQDKRFSGPEAGTLPPVLLGGSLQLLPYATLSMGTVLMEAKRSTLPDEKARLFPSFYVGLSIDANIFDAVASQLVTGRNAAIKVVTK
ncbi:MAG: hypothetical protein R3B70_23180 [Polyangiaceae bacterium]